MNSESYQNPFSRPSAAVFTSQDVNGDGLLEIPVASQLPAIPEDVSLDSTGFLVEWVNADTSGNYETALTALMNLGENYWFRLPASLVGKISASNNTAARSVTYTEVGHRGGRLPAAGLAAVHHPGVHPLRLGQPGGDQRLRAAGRPRGTWSLAFKPSPRMPSTCGPLPKYAASSTSRWNKRPGKGAIQPERGSESLCEKSLLRKTSRTSGVCGHQPGAGGYKTYEAETGDQALALYAQEDGDFDVAVLDIMMPASTTAWLSARSCAAATPPLGSSSSPPAPRRWTRCPA